MTTEKRLEAMATQIQQLENQNKLLTKEIAGLTQLVSDYAHSTRGAVESTETKIQGWFSVLNEQISTQFSDVGHLLLKISAKQGSHDQMLERMGNTNPNAGQSPLWHMQFGGQNPLGHGNPGWHHLYEPRRPGGFEHMRPQPGFSTSLGRPVHPSVNEESVNTYDFLMNISNQLYNFYKGDSRLMESGHVSFVMEGDKAVLDWGTMTPRTNMRSEPLYVQIAKVAQHIAAVYGRGKVMKIHLKTNSWDGAGGFTEEHVPLGDCSDLVTWVRSKLDSTAFGHITKSYAETPKKDDVVTFPGFLGGVDISSLKNDEYLHRVFHDVDIVVVGDEVHLRHDVTGGFKITALNLYNKLAAWYNQLPENEKLEKAQSTKYWLVYGQSTGPAARQQLKSVEMLVLWAATI